MVKTRLMVLIMLCLTACSPKVRWQSVLMDGSRTGVKAPSAANASEALGAVNDSCYLAPNGRVFTCGTASYEAAKALLGVQSELSFVKQVVARSAAEMSSDEADGALAYWTVDRIRAAAAELTGRKVDVAIVNIGGIRVDMPKGDVLMDDILSMFPFKNYLCYVALKGEDLLALFDVMAKRPQPVSGVKVVYADGKLQSLLVGGEPVELDRVYGVATNDFLLNGGDGLFVAKNAKELIITDKLVIDVILPFVQGYAERGEEIAYTSDDRMTSI